MVWGPQTVVARLGRPCRDDPWRFVAGSNAVVVDHDADIEAEIKWG
jgi:hypothetical protein